MNNENKGIHATGVSSRVWAMLVVVLWSALLML